MKNGKIIISITVSLICFILVFVMTVQLRTVKETDITSIESMREDELNEQIEIWKTKYEETQAEIDRDNEKINEYKEKTENNQEASELIETELEKMKTNLGKTDVEGEGIIVTLKNGESEIISEDLLRLINELKLAGAEAISINEQRIINFSEIVDVNSYILVNGQRISEPFVVKAIGNEQYLMSGISSKGGFSDTTKSKGKEISISQEKNIRISKYDKDINLKTINIK